MAGPVKPYGYCKAYLTGQEFISGVQFYKCLFCNKKSRDGGGERRYCFSMTGYAIRDKKRTAGGRQSSPSAAAEKTTHETTPAKKRPADQPSGITSG